MAELTQEEALAAQKANCPFCKIIAGEIPSKKVYEDDHMLAILDINPANKGHLLVMPKEHYYILPLVPPATFGHMFLQAQKLMKAMRKGLIVPRVTLFIANGGAAGQQSPHFLFHLIPREGDGRLNHLDVQECLVQQQNKEAIMQNTRMIMKNLPIQKPAPPVIQAVQQTSSPNQPADVQPILPVSKNRSPPELSASTPKEIATEVNIKEDPPQDKLSALMNLLEQEPGLHHMLIQDPNKVEAYVKANPILQQAFSGINLQQLSALLRHKEESPPQPIDEIPHAIDLSDEELRSFINQKPELKRLLSEDLKGLKKMIHHNPRLKHFFKKTSPEEVATRLEHDEPIDFDLLARHLE